MWLCSDKQNLQLISLYLQQNIYLFHRQEYPQMFIDFIDRLTTHFYNVWSLYIFSYFSLHCITLIFYSLWGWDKKSQLSFDWINVMEEVSKNTNLVKKCSSRGLECCVLWELFGSCFRMHRNISVEVKMTNSLTSML